LVLSEHFTTIYIFFNKIFIFVNGMKLDKKTKKAGKIVGTIAVIIVIFLGLTEVVLKEPIQAGPSFPSDHLFVDATYLLKTEETNESVKIICTPYLTNTWEKESGKIKIIAYVLETYNNLAIFKNTVEIGEISANSTEEVEIHLILSNSSYKVELLIFEEGKLKIKGKLTITAYPVYVWDDINHVTKQRWELTNTAPDYDAVH